MGKQTRKHDFSGYATKFNKRCTDGRVILPEAFADCDGKQLPLVWQHAHNDPQNVLGNVVLENREDGVYAYGYLNQTPNGKAAKEQLAHGDIKAMSIYANSLVEKNKQVIHGVIKEVSLVLSGANPGALIDYIAFQHSSDPNDITVSDDEAIIFSHDDDAQLEIIQNEDPSKLIIDKVGEITHADEDEEEEDDDLTVQDVLDTMNDEQRDAVSYLVTQALSGGLEDAVEHSSDSGEGASVADIVETMTDNQKTAMYYLVSEALEAYDESEDDDEDDEDVEHSDEGELFMKKNIFDNTDPKETESVISHSDLIAAIQGAREAKVSSLKDYLDGELRHADPAYGIENIEYLFPEHRNTSNTPIFIKRPTEWVPHVFNAAHHSPFARVKTVMADITEDEARARGYIKGKKKKEEVFTLLKRTTDPQTIYKKQKLDRDDIIDITDMDVVAWLKTEMRMMLDEEISRAVLLGDGRPSDSDDKIKEDKIRPIYRDNDLFSVSVPVAADASVSDVIDEVVRSRKHYKGSGNPTCFATTDIISEMLLLKDRNGRRIYETLASLSAALRVKEIIEVPVMDNQKRTVDDEEMDLLLIIVNMMDYTIGADKGGSVQMFDDFDIDYNQYKYLIETRCSGALTLPFSALIVERRKASSTPPTPPSPTEVTVDAVQIGGVTGTTDSTGIALTFDENVVGLQASHITLIAGTGSATKGALTGSGKNWTLAITDPVEGDLTVKISGLAGYTFGDEAVDVYAAL